ncbi:hypothetical protein PJE062_2315 [Pseudovibrio sp. JE062]|nr:hypothetical protein PJE062_2315 [Pseudovibrio sp. JE062]
MRTTHTKALACGGDDKTADQQNTHQGLNPSESASREE